MGRIIADVWLDDRQNIHILQPLETQLGNLGLVAQEVLIVRLLVADIEHLTSRPRAICLQRAIGILRRICAIVPIRRNLIAIGTIGMSYDTISIFLRILYTLAQLLLATERRLNRKDRRIATIVSLVIPTHQTELSLLHALTLQLVNNILNLVESYSNTHLRLILQSLMFNRCRYGLPPLTNTNFGSSCGVGKMLIILHALLQHLRHLIAFNEVLTITTRHRAIILLALGHWIEIYHKWLIRTAFAQVVVVRKGVFTLLVTVGLNALELQTLGNGEICTTLGLEATHREAQVLRIALFILHSCVLESIQ